MGSPGDHWRAAFGPSSRPWWPSHSLLRPTWPSSSPCEARKSVSRSPLSGVIVLASSPHPDPPHKGEGDRVRVDVALIFPAYAKLNLTLDVTGRRPDGYHEIDSVMQTISLHDLVWVERTDCRVFEVVGTPIDGENLVLKA